AAFALTPPVRANDPASDRVTLQAEFLPGQLTVEKVGTVYELRYRGDHSGFEYQIDVNHTDVKRGMLRVWERYSDCYPVTVAGPSFRNAAGTGLLPVNLGQ